MESLTRFFLKSLSLEQVKLMREHVNAGVQNLSASKIKCDLCFDVLNSNWTIKINDWMLFPRYFSLYILHL